MSSLISLWIGFVAAYRSCFENGFGSSSCINFLTIVGIIIVFIALIVFIVVVVEGDKGGDDEGGLFK